jgi:hypothetical protein
MQGKQIHGKIARNVRFMLTRVSSLSARMGKKHIRLTYGTLSDWSVKAMTYKYKFTCEYTKSVQTFEEIIEYDHEPSEDELEEDYNDWLSRYVVGGWERESNDT